jgi:type VI secretion system protein ImpE
VKNARIYISSALIVLGVLLTLAGIPALYVRDQIADEPALTNRIADALQTPQVRAVAAEEAADGLINAGATDLLTIRPLLVPALEAFLNDKYTWVPFSQIASLTVTRPTRLRDLLWATVRVETTTGEGGEVLAPALYYGSSKHESPLVRLGRMTDWIDDGGPIQRSAGLRMYLAGQRDYSLFQIETIEFGAAASANG